MTLPTVIESFILSIYCHANQKPVTTAKPHFMHRRQSWGLGGRHPQIVGWGVVWGLRGVLGGRERVSEKTIAYFARKASFFVSFLRNREKLTNNVEM